jgi:hypothetical protein
MPAPRRSLCTLIVLAVGVVPALSGCAGTENGPPSAQAGSGGFIDSFVEKLKREDDELEVKELSEHDETREEREESHEQAEQAHMEQVQAQGPEPEQEEP